MRAAPRPADREQLQRLDKGIDLLARVARAQDDGEQAGGAGEIAPPVGMARAVGQRGMQHPRHLGPLAQPFGDFARAAVVRRQPHRQARQPAQHQVAVIGGHAPAHQHAGAPQAVVQRIVACHHRAHQHIAAARLVLGQRLHRDIDTLVEGVEVDAARPGVVDRRQHALRLRGGNDGIGIGHFHRHRTRRLHPDQARLGTDHCGHASGVHRVVVAHRHAVVARQPFAMVPVGAVDVVRHQHVVAALEQREVDQRNRRQPGRQQQGMARAFDQRQVLAQRLAGRGGVQAVTPVGGGAVTLRTQFGQVAEHHGRATVGGGRKRGKAGCDVQFGLDRDGLQVMGAGCGLVGRRIGHGGFLAGC
ncbi:hypothetical protein D9M68_543600 [compost metagenome]